MRRRAYPKRRNRPGNPPGAFVVDPHAPKPHIRIIAYGPDHFEETAVHTGEEAAAFVQPGRVVWVDVEGLGNADTLKSLGQQFGMHELALEDVVHTHQRPKVDNYDDRHFVVMRGVKADCQTIAEEGGSTEQVSFFLTPCCLVSFSEHPGDNFDTVRRRLREKRGNLRYRDASYLLYALIDATIDAYFPWMERIEEHLEDLQEKVLGSTSTSCLREVHELRHELLAVRRIMSATREAVNALIRDSGEEISEAARLHLRDCYDHTVQLIDILESQREIAAGLIEIYLSNVSNRMNQIMKVLTIVSAIFIPINTVAGIYGMNFDTSISPWNMPELKWFYGYPAALALMALITIVQLAIMWRKGWMFEEWKHERERTTRH